MVFLTDPSEIRDTILHELSIYEPVLFDLSQHERDKYTDKKVWQFDNHFFVRVRDEKEYWYMFWTFWVD